MNNLSQFVRYMRQNKEIQYIINEPDTLTKCILCKHCLSSQKWSHVMEKHIKTLFGIEEKVNEVSGDGTLNGLNVEIKVSLGDNKGGFNFVQIRPDHFIDYYIFLVYDLYYGDLGKIHWFLIEKNQMTDLLKSYGQYAHGTISKHGSDYNTRLEYALRCNKIKQTKVWCEISKYETCIEEIKRSLKGKNIIK